VASFLDSDEVERVLHAKFTSGVRLPELRSVAFVLSHFAMVSSPDRTEQRTYPRMVNWFKQNWSAVLPWLHLVNLVDAQDTIVDGRRELYERCHVVIVPSSIP
jgi:hypothetical protein